MGNPKNPTACIYDSACWAPGKTPAYLIATFSGIIINPEFNFPLPPLNGTYMLQQVNETLWGNVANFPSCGYETGLGFSRIRMGYEPFELCFAGGANADCVFSFANSEEPLLWREGFCSISWVGPDGAMGNVLDLAKTLGIPAINKVQYEAYADAALKQTVRYANLYDGTRVHIKRDINS